MQILGPKLLNRSLNQGLLTKRGDGPTLDLNFAVTKALVTPALPYRVFA
jgi:hypothetical protein